MISKFFIRNFNINVDLNLLYLEWVEYLLGRINLKERMRGTEKFFFSLQELALSNLNTFWKKDRDWNFKFFNERLKNSLQSRKDFSEILLEDFTETPISLKSSSLGEFKDKIRLVFSFKVNVTWITSKKKKKTQTNSVVG